MKKRTIALLIGLIVISVLIVNAPAAWLSPAIRKASHGTVDFSNSWGTVWNGSAQLLIRRSDKETLQIPQALAWRLSIDSVLSQSATVTLNSTALKMPVRLDIKGNAVQVDAGQYHLPAGSLNTLGAPFNTLKPSGDVRLNWTAFTTTLDAKAAPAVPLSINIQSLRSGVTGGQVLGDYTVTATPKATTLANRWAIDLQTVANPAAPATLLLTGSGELGLIGPPLFELKAKAATPEARQRLQALLNFLGRRQGDEYVLRVN